MHAFDDFTELDQQTLLTGIDMSCDATPRGGWPRRI
jgi:hypothetical protein